MPGLFDLFLRIVDADYADQRGGWFTSDPGEYAPGNRVEVKKSSFFGKDRSEYREVTRVQRYGDYDKGWSRRVDSLRGCNCGRPGCPG